MTRLRTLAAAGLLLVVAAIIGWRWLMHTESGARWLLTQAQSATNDALQLDSLNGDLGSGLNLEGISFRTESFSVGIAAAQFSAKLGFIPLQLRVDGLKIQGVDVRLITSVEDRSQRDSTSETDSLALPLLIKISDSTVDDISVASAQSEQQYDIPQLSFSGSWHEQISLEASLTQVPVPYELIEPLDLRIRANGDLQLLEVELTADNVEFWSRGQFTNLADQPSWNVQSGLADSTVTIPAQEKEFFIHSLEVGSEGSVAEPASWSLGLSSPDLELTGDGEFFLGDDWFVDAGLQLSRFNPGTLLATWPADQPANGKLNLSLSRDQLVIDDSRLSVAATDTTLSINALVDLEKAVTEGELSWLNFSWPAASGLFSESGSVRLSGSPENWQVNGTIIIATTDIPTGEFRIDGSGDSEQLELRILDSQILGGNVAGLAKASWRNDRAWSAALTMSNLELAELNESWPSDVSGSINVQATETPYMRDVELNEVSGKLLAAAITANGQITLSESNFVARDLVLRHGNSRIAANGDPRSTAGIEFDIALDDVGRYLPDARGALNVAGTLSIAAQRPQLEITGNGSDIGFGQLQAAILEIREGSNGDCPINTELHIPELLIGNDEFSDVSVGLCGDESIQNITVEASYDEVDVSLAATGSGDKFPLPERWQGDLQQLTVELAREPPASLSAPVALSIASNSAAIDRTCLTSEAGMALCAEFDWLTDDHLNLYAEMDDVPLRLINRWLPVDLLFSQSISGHLQWSNSNDRGIDGEAELSMTAGTIVSASNSDISVPTDPGSFSFQITDAQALAGSATIPMPGFGRVAGSLAIPDISQGIDSTIDGGIDIEFSDMTIVAALLPFINEANGFFSADLDFTGRLSDPLLVGEFSVVDGNLDFVPFGLQLKQINLESKLFDDGQMELSGDFFAGEGRAEIFTRSDYAKTGAKGFELELRGKNLNLIDVPDINAVTDVDLRLNYDYRHVEIAGNILIPQARVLATKLAVTQDSESEDVVIVAGELPETVDDTAFEDDMNISGSVVIELGNEVTMDLGLATAKITGKTTFVWDDSLIPVADGRYDLTGSVQAFGQALEITEGSLRFPKIPANNPFVRVRAEREIYGNPQVKTAGVLVDGRLRQIAVEAYTRPATTEERALTLLVTGSDFDFEQGVGAIDFGTYIAPRVFVSYGVGIFETENVIRVRYDLKRGFGITATSGEKESGLDLSYRLER